MKALAKHLAEPETVIFVGSGISRWSGLPSWAGMISELVTFLDEAGKSTELVKDELNNGDLLQAASFGFDQLTQQQIGEFIRLSCRYGQAKPHLIHQKIVELGPTSFVTTNYDNLIEEALRQFRPDAFFPPPVTNRHLTEMASVAHAKQSQFIFKMHGDASDAESIVLTREQYRRLLPQGEWNRVLETVKTLMISRPVLYIGFGLRDPDFLYVRDLLSNTYQGASRDHYAVMSDMSDQEIDYWRRAYGVHIVTYKTERSSDGQISHRQLLDVLDDLKLQRSSIGSQDGNASDNASFLLTLTRHAARYSLGQDFSDKIRISVEPENKSQRNAGPRGFKKRYWDVDSLLMNGPSKTLLVGLPGSGKSYAMRFAVAELARRLSQAIVHEEIDVREITIPILVDMKQYAGSLWDLAEDTLPKGLSLKDLVGEYSVKIFVDAFNEMPKDYWLDAKYEDDFRSFVSSVKGAAIAVASRTLHGMPDSEFVTYSLENIDEDLAQSTLAEFGFQAGGEFDYELVNMFRRPFFFRLLREQKVKVRHGDDPRKIFDQFLSSINNKFKMKFQTELELVPILESVAFSALNNGLEVFSPADLKAAIIKSVNTHNFAQAPSNDISHWLVSEQLIQPLPRGKLAFFHQSVTEFLAAARLAKNYENDPSVLKHVLRLRRWDQAIMQAAYHLSGESARAFLDAVFSADQRLALASCKYADFDRHEIAGDLLRKCLRSSSGNDADDFQWSWAISDLPLGPQHEQLLRECVDKGGTLGCYAVVRLSQIVGADEKEALFDLLLEGERDYNLLVNGVAEAISEFVQIDDLQRVSDWLRENEARLKDDVATASSISHALRELPAGDVVKALAPDFDTGIVSELAANILTGIASDVRDQEWLDICVRLLPTHTSRAAVAVHFILQYGSTDEAVVLDSVSREALEPLVKSMFEGDPWALSALRNLCERSNISLTVASELASLETGMRLALLQYCMNRNHTASLFDCIHEIADNRMHSGDELKALSLIDLDWTGKSDLFVRVLAGRNKNLVASIMSSSIPSGVDGLGKVRFSELENLLAWVEELGRREADSWLGFQIGSAIGGYCDPETKKELLTILDDEDARHRPLVAHRILIYCDELSISDMSEASIAYLLSELGTHRLLPPFLGTYLLAEVADQAFVEERLLPLVSGEDCVFQQNLRGVLNQVGERHGRRYIM